MLIDQTHTKEQLKAINSNGYTWSLFDPIKKLHTFTLREWGKYWIIKAHPSDIENGSLDLMTKHGLSR